MDFITDRRRMIKVTAIVAGALAAIAGLVFLFLYNPSDIPRFPKCPFFALTGYKCPGCGTLRGIHSLLHLRFAAAWGYNPLMIVSIPLLAALVISKRVRRNRYLSYTVLGVTLIYWLVRNLV